MIKIIPAFSFELTSLFCHAYQNNDEIKRYEMIIMWILELSLIKLINCIIIMKKD